ncbi:MAG: DUF4129 domain-containing protein [Acidobacteriia bacterium]|nr:DUF4129 domain-containing protein [Terriglobia bacterium]
MKDGPQIALKQISMAEYVDKLRAASAFLNGENPAGIGSFRESLPGEWSVEAKDQSFYVKIDWLSVALLAREKSAQENVDLLRQARQRLDALQESAAGLRSPVPRADLDHARADVDRILRGREFQGAHEPTWWDKQMARARAWISRQLDRLFNRIGISASVGNALAWTLVILLGLLLSFWAVRSVINAARRAEMDLSGAIPAGQDWRYWAKIARAAAERGDYRAAIHAAYWTGVAQLEEIHLLPEDRSRTPRESLRMVQRGHAAYMPLAQLTRRLEFTWYGFQSATAEDWDDARKQLEALECLRNSTHAIANS